MHVSCLILQIICVLCLGIANSASENSFTVPHPEIDINVAEVCEHPKLCVHYNQCPINNAFGAGKLDEKMSIRFSDNIENTDESIRARTGHSGKICKQLETCCERSEIIQLPEPDDIDVYKGCGLRNPDGIQFKIKTNDSTLSQFGEFPWTVALIRTNPSFREQKLLCGGSLIHVSVVLTAAHCVHRMRNQLHTFKVRAGEWDTRSDRENIPHQDRDVANMIIHDNFHHRTLFHDIALLILAEPFVLRTSIQTICLPTSDLSSVGKPKCYATGWGARDFSNPSLRTAIMKKVELPVVTRGTCQTQLRRTSLGNRFTLHQSFMCAGGIVGEDTCIGDGGSPLVCPYFEDSDHYYQTGIVAGGVDCGVENVPGVYVDVAKHRGWIDRKMALHHFYLQSIV